MRPQCFARRITAAKVSLLALISLLALLSIQRYLPGSAVASANVVANAVVTVSAASYDAPVAADSIVAMFGNGLATSLAVGGTIPLPTQLAGTTVTIKDSLGVSRLAGLFFVSPGQINCVIPAGTEPGIAEVTVVAGNAVMSTGTVEVVVAAPSVFTAKADGTGAPAADFLRVLPDFSQAYEPAYQGTFPNLTPRPVDLGPENHLVFLVMYLTGLRGIPGTDGISENGSAENVRVVLGGLEWTPA